MSVVRPLFTTHSTNFQLRGSNILSLPRINTTSYGSKSIRYFGPKIWNFLDDNLRTQTDLQSFKKFTQQVNFENLLQYLYICKYTFLPLYTFLFNCNSIAFDEGRTLPNLLGCLLSRRFPVHASES